MWLAQRVLRRSTERHKRRASASGMNLFSLRWNLRESGAAPLAWKVVGAQTFVVAMRAESH